MSGNGICAVAHHLEAEGGAYGADRGLREVDDAVRPVDQDEAGRGERVDAAKYHAGEQDRERRATGCARRTAGKEDLRYEENPEDSRARQRDLATAAAGREVGR